MLKPTLHRPALLPLQVLEDACGTHAATDAHRHHAIACVAPLHFMHELDGEFRTSGPHRVTEGDSSSVDVELVHVYAQLTNDSKRLGGEGFIQFDEVNVVECKTCELKHFWNGDNGANAHDFGTYTSDSEANETQ